jgi:DNA-binding MarR family transcriptional regulator
MEMLTNAAQHAIVHDKIDCMESSMHLDEQLYSTLAKTSLLLGDSDNRFFQKYRLGSTRYYALVHVQQTPGISLSELSKRLLCTKGNATRILKSLESDGLLRRETDQRDNRALHLFLTQPGADLLAALQRAYQEFNHERFDCLDASQKAALKQQLDTLNDHLAALITRS